MRSSAARVQDLGSSYSCIYESGVPSIGLLDLMHCYNIT